MAHLCTVEVFHNSFDLSCIVILMTEERMNGVRSSAQCANIARGQDERGPYSVHEPMDTFLLQSDC